MKQGIRNQLLVSEYIHGIEWNRNADMRVLDAIAEYAPEVGLFIDGAVLVFNRGRIALVGFGDESQAESVYEALQGKGAPECDECGEVHLFQGCQYTHECMVYLDDTATPEDIHEICVMLRNLAPFCEVEIGDRGSHVSEFMEGEHMRVSVSSTSYMLVKWIAGVMEDACGGLGCVTRVETQSTDGCDGETVVSDGERVMFGMIASVRDRDWKMML